MAFINKYTSSSQLQQSLCQSLQKPFSLLLVMVMVMTPMQYSMACPRTEIPECAEYSETYDRIVPQQLKVLDAVDAQLSYINLAGEGVNNEKVRSYVDMLSVMSVWLLLSCVQIFALIASFLVFPEIV
jgi:hypothetical protein